MEQINFDTNKILVVAIEEVVANSYNPKDQGTEEYKRVVKSIDKNGLRLPIVVREVDGKYEIIDGEQRWRACNELGYKQVIIYNEGVMDDLRAKELTIWYQQQVPFNEVDLANLISEMIGASPDTSIPFNEEEIDNFLKMTQFDINDFKEASIPSNTDSSDHPITFSLAVTKEQLEVIEQALDACIKEVGGEVSRSRALELIMADYLSGN